MKNDCQLGSHLRILALTFSTNAEEAEHASRKWVERISSEMSPILYSLRKFPLVCRDMEAEAIVWRLAEFVQLCYTRAELHGIWHIILHVNVLAQEEICLWIGHLKFSPCIWLRHERWHHLIELSHGVKFPF